MKSRELVAVCEKNHRFSIFPGSIQDHSRSILEFLGGKKNSFENSSAHSMNFFRCHFGLPPPAGTCSFRCGAKPSPPDWASKIGGRFHRFSGLERWTLFSNFGVDLYLGVAVLLKNQSPGVLIYIDLTSDT